METKRNKKQNKEKIETTRKITKILYTKEGKKFYQWDNNDIHTQHGYIKSEDVVVGKRLLSNVNKEFFAIEPSFIDLYKKIKRKAQIVPLKEIGVLITETGLNKKSNVVDAGSGSGAVACFLSNYVKKIITYEIRKDHIDIVKQNLKFLNIKNVVIKNKDIYKGIDEKDVDVIFLDLPEPWNVVKHASKSLKIGGFLVSYSPTIPQIMDFVNAVRSNERLLYLKTIEIIKREWEVNERIVRPKSNVLHSGFLSFARKII